MSPRLFQSFSQVLILLFATSAATCQGVPDSMSRKIDSIFKSYNDSTPGCAVAVIQNGTVIFQKGYGRANLEYAAPITPNTVFHIASESKQYVAFCMLLLEKEGKLSLNDDIRKFLPYVPDFGHKITIKQLIHHTSGLRDQWQLLASAGWQLDDVITQDHIRKLVSKQKALNFNPGEEHMYSNTGYTLMAEIVEKVSGLTLRKYADEKIFQPLGMKDTHFHDNYQEIVPGRAYSYSPGSAKTFQHAVLSYSTVGATSLFTTVLDETKWLQNYETGTVGGKDLIEKMYEVGVLNDGRKLTYAFALNIGKHKGWKQIGHGGGDAGFRTYACRFPEKSLGIVVFSNHGAVNPTGLANRVADVFLNVKEEVKPEEKKPVTDSAFLKKLQGKFYTHRGSTTEMFWENGKLMGRNTFNGSTYEIKLNDIGNNRYQLPDIGVWVLDHKNRAADSVREIRFETPYSTQVFYRQPSVAAKITADYAGKYYSDETEAFYYITEKNGQLSLEHRKFSTVGMKPVAPDQFTTPHWWMSHLRFIRDKSGKIVAFEVNAGRVQHLRFERVPK